MDVMKHSPYVVLEAINEAVRTLHQVITFFYNSLQFPIPTEFELTEESDTNWPSLYDDLLIEYVVILLSPGDFSAKEQAKIFWRSKVVDLTSSMDAGTYIVGYEEDDETTIVDPGEW